MIITKDSPEYEQTRIDSMWGKRTPDHELRALAHFVHVYVDAQTRRPVPIPEAIRTAVEALPRMEP